GRAWIHQSPPLLEHVASAICGFDLAADDVRQRHLGNLAGEVRSLGTPVPERRAEPVCRDPAIHALQDLPQHRVTQWLAGLAAREDEAIGVTGGANRFQDSERTGGQKNTARLCRLPAHAPGFPRRLVSIPHTPPPPPRLP